MTGRRRQQSQSHSATRDASIRDVWASNLEEEIAIIRDMMKIYPYVSIHAQDAGSIGTPLGEFRSTDEHYFQTLVCNVNLLKLLQLGITFFNADGQRASPVATWQFNFKFSLQNDMYSKPAIDALGRQGYRFQQFEKDGIDIKTFAELITTSGLVLCDDVTWLSFSNGTDFGHLIHVLTGAVLQQSENEYFELMAIFFPNLYDVKYLMRSCKDLKGSLTEVAETIKVGRHGSSMQAGTESILVGEVFFKMRSMYFEGIIDHERYNHMVYGVGSQ